MRSLLLVSLLATALGLAQAPPAPKALSPGKAGAGFQIVPVDDGVKVLEEKSLIFCGQLSAGAQQQSLPGGDITGQNSNAAVGAMPIGPQMTDMKEEPPSAYRAYAFRLQPRETLKFRLHCDARGKVLMRFLPSVKQDAMTGQVRRANNAAAPLRASRIEISNPSDAPCTVALLLYGEAQNPFRLEIERRKGN